MICYGHITGKGQAESWGVKAVSCSLSGLPGSPSDPGTHQSNGDLWSPLDRPCDMEICGNILMRMPVSTLEWCSNSLDRREK